MKAENYIIPTGATLYRALEKLNSLSGDVMTLLATDAEGRLQGTLTDGDIRRALLRGESLQTRVSEVMHRDFRYLEADNPSVERMKEMRNIGIRLVPVLDREGKISEVIDTERTQSLLPVRAILMAGGKGERLRPLTLDTPKPLLKVGGRPVIDYNIKLLSKHGIKDVTVTVNYLGEQIEEHFSEPVEGIRVKTLREPSALGTIGSAALAGRHLPMGDTLLMNSDLLTSLNLEEMYLCHKGSDNAITIAAVPYNVSVPYAVLHTTGDGRVTSLEEKPSKNYFANAGIYMLRNEMIDLIPEGEVFHATDLIELAIEKGLRVGYFPLIGTWIDIGSPSDFRHADELMRANIR